MGKRVLSVALLFCVFFCGCAKQQPKADASEPPKIADTYNAIATIEYNEISLTAELIRDAPGCCVIDLLAPESLKGMKISVSPDRIDIGYKGIETGFDPSSVSGSAVAKSLVAVLDAAAQEQGLDFQLEGENFLIEGQTDSGAFALQMDKNTGNILSVEIPSIGLKASFENFQIS